MLTMFCGVALLVLHVIPFRDGLGGAALELSESAIEDAFRIAEERFSQSVHRQKRMASEGMNFGRPATRPELLHLMSHRMPRTARSVQNQKWQRIYEEATRVLRDTHGLSHEEVFSDLQKVQLRGKRSSRVKRQCTTPEITCNDTEFRTIDGSCNNLDNPSWGQASSCFQRWLEPRYSDGVSTFPTDANGDSLPNARMLSLILHPEQDRPTTRLNHMHMAYGQLLDHDITLTSPSLTVDNQLIDDCCPVRDGTHEQCAAITSDGYDPNCADSFQDCMNFVRNAICPRCAMGPRQQINEVTSYIDASHVYGNDQTVASGLRTFTGGRLRITENQYGPLLPEANDPNNDFCSLPPGPNCFESGDIRVNQHPSLTSLQTILLREHNMMADNFASINPQWDDERIYQECRKVIGAIMQVITYKEYLLPVVGDDRMRYFGLYLDSDSTYDSTIDATLYTEFSTCGFRLHSQVNNFFREVFNVDGDNGHLLRNIFFTPFELYDGKCESYLEGLIRGNAQKFDRYMGCDVTHHLYEQPAFNVSGLDLAAINIQRGRDHGIPNYVNLVNFCGGPRIRSFEDLCRSGLMTNRSAELLRSVYNDVLDIDCFSGCLFEILNRADSIVGPTMRCMIGLQFNYLKYGDRFWFQFGSFTPEQQQELEKITLSGLICQTTVIPSLPRNAFYYPSNRNPEVDCSEIPWPDFSKWQES